MSAEQRLIMVTLAALTVPLLSMAVACGGPSAEVAHPLGTVTPTSTSSSTSPSAAPVLTGAELAATLDGWISAADAAGSVQTTYDIKTDGRAFEHGTSATNFATGSAKVSSDGPNGPVEFLLTRSNAWVKQGGDQNWVEAERSDVVQATRQHDGRTRLSEFRASATSVQVLRPATVGSIPATEFTVVTDAAKEWAARGESWVGPQTSMTYSLWVDATGLVVKSLDLNLHRRQEVTYVWNQPVDITPP